MKVNESCVIGTDQAGKADSCAGCPGQKYCSTGQPLPEDPDIALIANNLKNVKNILIVLSGKGGVGKSLTAMMIARSLTQDEDCEVGLLDIDICGPSIPTMTKTLSEGVHQSGSGWSPVVIEENLSLMSAGFLIGDKDQAVIWRGSKKTNLIKNFLRDTDWGDLDYLVIDAPPGTSDEHLTIIQTLKKYKTQDPKNNKLFSVIVTTSSTLSIADVRREISFCRKGELPILGVIENMSGIGCPKCGHVFDVYNNDSCGDNTDNMCTDLGIDKICCLPMNPLIAYLIDKGDNPYEDDGVKKEMLQPYDNLCGKIRKYSKEKTNQSTDMEE